MKDDFVTAILREMMPVLDQKQMDRLKTVVRVQLCGYDISKKETGLMRIDQNGPNYLKVFLDMFRQNGKSEGTIEQYQLHLSRMLSYIGKKPDVDGDISGWQYTSCGEIPGIKGDVDLDIAYEDPTAWSQPAVDPGVIYTVSVADVLTRGQAEIARQQFAARGIVGVVHKVKILG